MCLKFLQNKTVITYIIAIIIPLIVGVLASILTYGNMDIYSSIVEPPLAPPMWLFPIVWTILYVLMGISSARIWLKGNINLSACKGGVSDLIKDIPTSTKNALTWYFFQLALNFFWSLIFFNLKAFYLAFFWIILLWWSVYKMIMSFKDIDTLAAKLQYPYIIWISFASLLTLAIALLN